MPERLHLSKPQLLRQRHVFPVTCAVQISGRQLGGRPVALPIEHRRLLEVERTSPNTGFSGDSMQRVVQSTVTEDSEETSSLKLGQSRVMAQLILIDGFRNRDLSALVADLLNVTMEQYTASQMTYDLHRPRLKGLIFRPRRTNRFFITPHRWKVARLFSRLEARLFRPATAMFTAMTQFRPIRCGRPRIASTRNSTS